MKVTFFKDVFDKASPHHVNILTALDRIKEGQSKETIDEIREGKKDLKKTLPVVCFSGEFATRNDEALFDHSGLIVSISITLMLRGRRQFLPRILSFIAAGFHQVGMVLKP